MAPLHEKKASLPPAVCKHYYLHHKSTKIAARNVRFAIFTAIFTVSMDILIYFTKDRFEAYTSGRPEYADWNRFLGLKEWVQWTVLGIITCWSFLEVGFAKLLQYAVQNESRPHLQVWLLLYTLDVFLSCSVVIALICLVVPSTQILLGIIGIVFSLTELYYFSILYRYFVSLKTTARYDVCQTEDDKISVTC